MDDTQLSYTYTTDEPIPTENQDTEADFGVLEPIPSDFIKAANEAKDGQEDSEIEKKQEDIVQLYYRVLK